MYDAAPFETSFIDELEPQPHAIRERLLAAAADDDGRDGFDLVDEARPMTTKLARLGGEHAFESALPPCPQCAASIGFAAEPGGVTEWWRCTACQAQPMMPGNGPVD